MTDQERCCLAAHIQAIINKHMGGVEAVLELLKGGQVPERDETLAAWVASRAIEPPRSRDKIGDYLDRTVEALQAAHRQFAAGMQAPTSAATVTFYEICNDVVQLKREILAGRLVGPCGAFQGYTRAVKARPRRRAGSFTLSNVAA